MACFTDYGLKVMANSDVEGGHRRIYRRKDGKDPSDLRDAEWARLDQ